MADSQRPTAILCTNNRIVYRKEIVKQPTEGPRTEEGPRPVIWWEKIQTLLSLPIPNVDALADTILNLQPRKKNMDSSQLRGLKQFCKKFATAEEGEAFFKTILPRMQKLVLRLEELGPIPLLTQQVEAEVTLSCEHISMLLAAAFFCILPQQEHKEEQFPEPSFCHFWWVGAFGDYPVHNHHRMRCFINYFKRVTEAPPKGNVTFQRKVNGAKPIDWGASDSPLRPIEVHPNGYIEDSKEALHSDFANKYIGGGVLQMGCVQEEILFTVKPELIVSTLICSVMKPNEAIVLIGGECYSKTKGYAFRLEYDGDHVDSTELYVSTNLICHREILTKTLWCVAMDALDFRKLDPRDQFSPPMIERELNKAYIAFTRTSAETDAKLPAISTGNWGGGAFLGNRPLKALIQWMAASHVGRDVIYYSFREKDVTEPLASIAKTLLEHKVTVGQLWKLLSTWPHTKEPELFAWLKAKVKA